MILSYMEIEKTNPESDFVFFHGVRQLTIETTPAEDLERYFSWDSFRFDYSKDSKHALKSYIEMYDPKLGDYLHQRNKDVPVKEDVFIFDLIFDFKEEHSVDDVLELVSALDKKYGWKEILEGSVLGDEDEHPYIVVFLLASDGLYLFKQSNFPKRLLCEIQIFIGEILRKQKNKKANTVRLSDEPFNIFAKGEKRFEFEMLRKSDELSNVLRFAVAKTEENHVIMNHILHDCKIDKDLEK